MTKTAIIIGGGPAGMETASQLARLGIVVDLVEKQVHLGGHLNSWDRLFPNRRDSKEVIDYLFEYLIPERITLGSLRGLQSTINFSKDRSWVNYLNESSNWGKKINFETRYKMYKTIISYLKRRYKFVDIGLCKETMAMWEKLGMTYQDIKCNCIF